ncbi:MAG: shikimate dehydrogenase [Clostridia bacterium]|nr:shikimate dehydrogenase [Clostridia bacterium]
MRYGLIGEHLGHSFSREIHEGITGEPYDLVELTPAELPSFMTKRDFAAINVTIPYKTAVMPFLDEISEAAQKIGAVNTIVNKNGKLYGYNTDFAGMRALIEYAEISIKSKKVLILGTGGTSKTAKAVMQSLGAAEIYRVSRSVHEDTITYEQALECHSDAQIIVNTTPVGMYPNEGRTPIDLADFPNVDGVVDAIYHPLRTDLVLQARRRGIRAVGGLYMLCAQAVEALNFFRDKTFDGSVTEDAYHKLKKQKENIVLIGMPTSGKSTIGRLLADAFKMNFVDSDEAITETIGRPIPGFIEEKGEKVFRAVESDVITEIAQKDGCIVATGGGAVLDEKNVLALKRNGVLVFLDRSLEKLAALPDRPLSSDPERLRRFYDVRHPIYRQSADIAVDGDGTPEQVAQLVLKALEKDTTL